MTTIELNEEARKNPVAEHKNAEGEPDPAAYEHPTATRWFRVAPCLRKIPLFGEVTTAFGPRFSISLGLCYTLSKGAGGRIINVSRQPMFIRSYGVNVARYQRLSTMYALGWSLKPFIASMADVIALFGYTKRWYMVFSAALGAAAALGYALLPKKRSSAELAAVFLFLVCLAKANIDILSQGHFSRSMRQNPKAGPAVVSWVWAMTFVGTIIASSMMGPLSDAKLTYVGILVAAVLQFVTAFFFIFNWYGEKKNRTNRRMDAFLLFQEQLRAKQRHPIEVFDDHAIEPVGKHQNDERYGVMEVVDATERNRVDDFEEPRIASFGHDIVEFNISVAMKNWRFIAYAVVMTCGIVAQACVTVLGSRRELLYACIAIASVFIIGAFLALPFVVAKAAVFIYLNTVLYLQISSVLSNFYLAKPACLPDGPHFSYTFYQTFGALITDVGGVAGTILFRHIFSKHRYAFVFIVTSLLQVAGSIFDLIIVKRWNVHIGIPDHAAYILGDAIVYEICFVLSLMPAQILMSRLCPRGTETIAFALLAGFNSAGVSMSMAIGSLLMENFWPISAKPPCNFKNLPLLIITGHLCMPLLIIPLAFLMLPNARICDRIDTNGNVIPDTAEPAPVQHYSPPHRQDTNPEHEGQGQK